MPKIGKMEQIVDNATGEVLSSFVGECEIKGVGRFRADPNPSQSGEKAPTHVIEVKGREIGCMWLRDKDRNGNRYFEIKLDGYPLTRAWYLRGFQELDDDKKPVDGSFELNYSAPRSSSASEEAA
ncbi:MAG: DUF736 family protein [Cognatishimia sp.]